MTVETRELPAMIADVPARDVGDGYRHRLAYSFCTLVTDRNQYEAMRQAFEARGFDRSDCEFIYVDNSKTNRMDAYQAYNVFLQEACGRYVVLCHQDILPLDHDRARLDALLAELTERDPHWGLCGNAGADVHGDIQVRITDPNGADRRSPGGYPAAVMSLDENFIIARRSANLALSRNLSGYHWQGSDLCILADILGYSAYVIDFHLLHKSPGVPPRDYFVAGERLKAKYAKSFRSRWQHSPSRAKVFISASRAETFAARLFNRIKRTIRV